MYRKAGVRKYGWQEDIGELFVASDSDWGGTSKDRRSTSGGVWMLGKQTIKNLVVHAGSVCAKQRGSGVIRQGQVSEEFRCGTGFRRNGKHGQAGD